MKGLVAVGMIAFSVIAAGCTLLPSPTPDTRCHPNGALSCTTVGLVPVGELVRSWGVDAPACKAGCGQPVEVAWAGMEQRSVGHPPLTAIDEYVADRHTLCGDTLCIASGYLGIFVFTFDDSTTVPVIVSCPGIAACQVIERYGS